MSEKVLFAWSGGKDSAMALYELKKNPHYTIVALLTTITSEYDRISMHGIRRELLERQAESIGIPLEKVFIPKQCSDEEYTSRMKKVLKKYKAQGVTSVAFGDIFLEDLRRYREDKLAKINMKAIFPLWQRESAELAESFINAGFRAVITCVDSAVLGKNFVGRVYDKEFIADLPRTVDPCGENGEFHSFVFDGPIFTRKAQHGRGLILLVDDRFWYCDLIPFQ